MQDGRMNWTRLTRAMVLLAGLMVLVGCGDAQKRRAGKNLRDATDEARRLYDKALRTLSNPSVGDASADDALNVEALNYLKDAQDILTTSLRENYTSLKSDDPNQTPAVDAGTAKTMLSLIDQLQAHYYIWQFDHSVAEAERITGTLHRYIEQARVRGLLLQLTETYATLSEDAIRKAIDETEKSKTKLDETIQKLREDMQTQQGQLDEQKKRVAELTSRSVELRTQTALARGAESQKKLEEALKHETEITKIRNAMDRINGLMIQARSTLAAEVVRQSEAAMKITVLQEIQTRRGSSAEQIAQTLDQRKEELLAACKDVAKTASELDALAIAMTEQSRQAFASLHQACNTLEGAMNLIESSKQAQAYSELARAKVSEGGLQRELLSFRLSLQDATDRLKRVWENLPDAKPAAPDAKGVASFLESTAKAQEAALSAYAKAVESWERSARAAGRESDWLYRRELVVGMLEYAAVLDAAGRNAEATEQRKKARDYFVDIEAAANQAGKPRSVAALKEFVRSETGL